MDVVVAQHAQHLQGQEGGGRQEGEKVDNFTQRAVSR